MRYIEIQVDEVAAVSEIVIAELFEIGYDGFEEKDTQLNAFIEESAFNENDLILILNKYHLNYSKSIIKDENWNRIWEANFQPVVIDNFVAVRAEFHQPFTDVLHEIVITPKMSFGTGHHATTFMMLQLMRTINFTNKTVFDFGTGTGILAILAEKLEAKKIIAGDNDDWSITNAVENVATNHCKNITIEKISDAKSSIVFDIIIANINKNIILENLSNLNNCCVEDGEILLSGLLEEDEKAIIEAVAEYGWKLQTVIKKSGWIAMDYKKVKTLH